jgi:hypothetical protein
VSWSPIEFAAVEILKLAYTLFVRYRKIRTPQSPEVWALGSDEESYLSERSDGRELSKDGGHRPPHWLLGACLGLAWTTREYAVRAVLLVRALKLMKMYSMRTR